MRDLPSQMQSFGPMDVIIGCVLSLLLSHQCLSAPQVPGSPRSESAEGSPALTLANPFGSSDEERRLLQSYISGHLKDNQGSPDLTTWEQEIFYLFSLHDYDRSGQMDGLELMKLLSDFLSHHSLGQQSADSVVSMVDTLLQTQDLNQDGMLDPSELLALPAERHTVKPQVKSDTEGDIFQDAPVQPAEEVQSEQQPAGEDLEPQAPHEVEPPHDAGDQQQAQDQDKDQDVSVQEDHGQEPPHQQDQDQELQEQKDHIPEPQVQEAVQQEQHHAPVHQGQPEM